MYTVADTPEIVARIDADLAAVTARVRAGDPHLRALVLTGGFARGEGAVLDGQPQNDYDLVAVRGSRPPIVPYARLHKELEGVLGMHVDLAPVPAWRLPFVRGSLFWYETALRGRVLWGADVRARIPVTRPRDLDRSEGLRLLVNRAAGLLLFGEATPPQKRLQASKALLAAGDAHVLARGDFPPSQRERQGLLQRQAERGALPDPVLRAWEWHQWAFAYKTDPGAAPDRDADAAWRAARLAVLEAVPVALRQAGLRSLDDYARRDGLADLVVWLRRSRTVPQSRRFVRHPTARVRVATLRLLDATPDGRIAPDEAQRWLGPLAAARARPVPTLDALRQATLQ